MLEILTLLSGLLVGPQRVELAVSPAAAAVEVRLDGELVERLVAPPWSFTLDLGDGLAPHVLAIESRDAAGRPVDAETRWINQPEGGPAAAGEPGGDLYLVVEPNALGGFETLVRERKKYLAYKAIGSWDSPGAMLQLGEGHRYHLMFPGSDELPVAAERDLFASYQELGPKTKAGEGLSHQLTHWWPQSTPGRTADAVAVAGWRAARQPRPRAVVLLTAGEEDASLLAPAEARAYLAALGVPLHVWTTFPAELAETLEANWGEVTSVYDWGRLQAAFQRVERALAAQRSPGGDR